MNIVFLNSPNFLARELNSALRRRSDVRLIAVELPYHINDAAAPLVFDQIKQYLPALVVSLNGGGYDYNGKLSELILATGSYQVNWYYDDPRFDEMFFDNIVPAHKNRIDFVMDPSFVPQLKARGYQAYFLPLAVDLQYFNMTEAGLGFERDVAFVGTSSIEFMDKILGPEQAKELENHAELIARMKKMYFQNPTTDLGEYLLAHEKEWTAGLRMSRDKFVFSIQWMVEYLYRRDFVVSISKKYKDRFVCFGDPYWANFVKDSHVSTDAMYYVNLCRYYRTTRVNLNLNRIQMRMAFTQRLLDCKASGAFLLTDRRALVDKFFVVSGSDTELVQFDSPDHCRELIDYYLKHEDERQKIALAGREKILQNHTYDARLAYVISVCKEVWGI